MKKFLNLFSHVIYLDKFQFWFVVVLSAVVIFHRLGEAPLAGDDCYYSEKAKEMARTGDYFTLKYGYHHDFDSKPPFIFWMNSFSGKIFGFNNFSMRLGSALLGFVSIVVTFLFVRRIYDKLTGLFSAIVLTFTQQYLYHARSAVTDGPLAAFIAFALFSFFIAENYNKIIFFYLMGIFTGMAVMTKQVNGFLIYIIIVVYTILSGRTKIYSSVHFYLGVILSLIIFLPWHIWSILTYGENFINSYFGIIIAHGITGVKGQTVEPWYEHIKKIIENYWPWLPFLINAVIDKFRKNGSFKEAKNMFILVWAFVPLFLFQLCKVKHTQNLNPIYVPFSILVAEKLKELNIQTKNLVTKILLLISLFVAMLFLAFPIIPKTMDSREYVQYLPILPYVKNIRSKFYTLHSRFWYFSNATWFYADRRVVGVSEEELVEKILSDKKYYFLVFADDFYRLKRKIPASKLKLIKSTKKIVLFSNN